MSNLMNLLARAGNNALLLNPPTADIDITDHGSDWLWAVFSIMGASFVGVTAWAAALPANQRAFHYIVSALLATASIAYFCLAADLGSTPITVEFLHGAWARMGNGLNGLPTRSVFYVRYIDWVITTPLLLLTLLLVAPIPLSTVFFTIFMDIVMIICGLIGALVSSNYKWAFYVFAWLALLVVYYVLFFTARKAAKAAGDDVHKAYLSGAGALSFLWFFYGIAWGLSEGGNTIHPDGEAVFYGVLDVLAKPVFSIYHLWALSRVDYNRLGLANLGNTDVNAGRAARKIVDGRHSDVTAADPHTSV